MSPLTNILVSLSGFNSILVEVIQLQLVSTLVINDRSFQYRKTPYFPEKIVCYLHLMIFYIYVWKLRGQLANDSFFGFQIWLIMGEDNAIWKQAGSHGANQRSAHDHILPNCDQQPLTFFQAVISTQSHFTKLWSHFAKLCLSWSGYEPSQHSQVVYHENVLTDHDNTIVFKLWTARTFCPRPPNHPAQYPLTKLGKIKNKNRLEHVVWAKTNKICIKERPIASHVSFINIYVRWT